MPDPIPSCCSSHPGPPYLAKLDVFRKLETSDPLLHVELTRHGRSAAGMWICDPEAYAAILDRLGRTPAP